MPNQVNQYTNETMYDRGVRYLKKLNGKTRRIKHYRCSNCRARKSLAKELWEYIRHPHCQKCGACNWRMDLNRSNDYIKRRGVFDSCKCNGLLHPHRRGSSVWCVDHPTGPTQEDHEDRCGH